MKTNPFENTYVRGWIENGVLFAEFKPNILDMEAALSCVAERVAASAGRSWPVLIDARKVTTISKEARDYFASDEGSTYVLASALIIDSVVGKFLGNFFLQINKPKVPLRLFNSQEDAAKWLEQFIDPAEKASAE